MSKKKLFQFGDHVRVEAHRGRDAFEGTVYSEYRNLPRRYRTICVNHPSGAGIGVSPRYVTKFCD